MQRYRQYGQLDDAPELVGDAGFTRLDMLTDPAMLPEGVLAISENLRFDSNGTTVRGGIARQFPAGTNVGTIYGAGIYKPDTNDDQFALVCANRLVIFNPGTQTLTGYNYPAGQTVAFGDTIDLVQAGVGSGTLPVLYILRGLDKTVLKLDGGTVSVATGFPSGEFALFYGDRIATNATTQAVKVSDFLDFTTWSQLNQFQIRQGGDDYLTCFLPYQKDYVLIGARKSWSVAFFDPGIGAGGYAGGLSDSSFLRQLTAEAGPVGPKAALEALGYIWFITDNAIYAFAPQLDNQLTVLGKPVSADIQPIMGRMSAKYARGAAVERWGYRLYFALPINDEAVNITNLVVTATVTLGIDVPFDVPANVASGALATVTTSTPHGLTVGETVLLNGVGTSGLNGEFAVASVISATQYTFACDVTDSTVTLGHQAYSTRVAERNNVIAVYNLNNKGWESIDSLPSGFYADWLKAADYGTQRRLWVVDATAGPALYEENESDQIGDVLGGVNVPFDVPVEMSSANAATAPIPARFRTRCLRWGAYPRKVRGAEVRSTLNTDSAVTMSLLARTPNNRLWTGTRDFVDTQFEQPDANLRKLCGERALEAQIEINVTSGRPTFRSVMVETVNVGKVEE